MPVAPTVSVSPDPASNIDPIVCTSVGAQDPDGDTITESFSWSINGTTVTETSDTLWTQRPQAMSSPALSPSQMVCSLQRSQHRSQSPTLCRLLDPISLSPSPLRTNDNLTATVVASDIDGDPLTLSYEWSVNGAVVQSGSSNSLDGAQYFDKGDQVFVTVTANDGIENGASETSSTETVVNTDPVISAVNISTTGMSPPTLSSPVATPLLTRIPMLLPPLTCGPTSPVERLSIGFGCAAANSLNIWTWR